MYKRLSDAAAMYQIGKTGLWRPPDLQLALNWQKKQKPTRSWAQRYDEAFERAIVFLDSSRITYEAELKNQEMLQKRQLRRARITAIVLGTATVISILFLVFGYTQRLDALRQKDIAEEQKNVAIIKTDEAVKALELAEQREKEAKEALNKFEVANKSLQEALRRVQAAVFAEEAAKVEAEKNLVVAQQERDIATTERKRADDNLITAKREYERADKLLMLTKARAMAGVSIQMEDDNNLAGLLAKQAYIFNTRYEGKKYDPFIHNALYKALTRIKGNSYNALKVPGVSRNRINSVAVSSNDNTFYAAGADGRVFKADIVSGSIEPTFIENRFPNRTLALSRDDRYLITAGDSTFVQLHDLQEGKNKPKVIRLGTSVHDAETLPNNQGFLVSTSDALWMVSFSGTSKKASACH